MQHELQRSCTQASKHEHASSQSHAIGLIPVAGLQDKVNDFCLHPKTLLSCVIWTSSQACFIDIIIPFKVKGVNSAICFICMELTEWDALRSWKRLLKLKCRILIILCYLVFFSYLLCFLCQIVNYRLFFHLFFLPLWEYITTQWELINSLRWQFAQG